MSNELTEEQIEDIWRNDRPLGEPHWGALSTIARDVYSCMLNAVYRLGRESVEEEQKPQGWTDRELKKAVSKAAGIDDVFIDAPDPDTKITLTELKALRRILIALNEHEPPKPEPGTRYVTMNGDLAFVDPIGRLVVVEGDGTMVIRAVDEPWPELTPARVIEDGGA